MAIFLTLPFLGLVLLFNLDYDREFAWNFLKGDCSDYANWIYNRIYNNPKPVDVAFIGSSVTKSSINDFLLEKTFRKHSQLDWHFANLSFCQYGRNMNFVILKDLLTKKDVKFLVLEVRQDENRFGHPMFPYLADNETVLASHLLFNHDCFRDLYLASVSRVEYWKQRIFYKKPDYEKNERDYGHAYWNQVVDSTKLEVIGLGEVKLHQKKEIPIFRSMNMQYPKYYIEKINRLCKTHDVELLFLYTPFYGGIGFPPKELAFFQRFGEVFIPPASFFEKKSNWADRVHINIHGANPNSIWFAEEFIAYLKRKGNSF